VEPDICRRLGLLGGAKAFSSKGFCSGALTGEEGQEAAICDTKVSRSKCDLPKAIQGKGHLGWRSGGAGQTFAAEDEKPELHEGSS
jgi:hypothetical protein